MLTIFADNTMILGSIADRQDMPVVATSTITRGLERLAVRVLRAVVPVVGVYAQCVARLRQRPVVKASMRRSVGNRA